MTVSLSVYNYNSNLLYYPKPGTLTTATWKHTISTMLTILIPYMTIPELIIQTVPVTNTIKQKVPQTTNHNIHIH